MRDILSSFQSLCVFGVWWFLGASSLGAVWYVDPAATGSKKGTDWPNAWTSFSGVVWGSSGVKSGDTLYISGGTYANASLTVGASGTAGSPISISSSTDSGHNSPVVFEYDSQGDQCSTTYAFIASHSYIVFNGLRWQNLRNILNRYNGYCLYGSGSGIVVQNCTVSNCNNGFNISGTANVMAHCTLQAIRGDAGITFGSSGSWGANLIYSNSIECYVNTTVPSGVSGRYVGPDPLQVSSGVDIFNNVIRESFPASTVYTSTQHPDTVQCIGNYVRFFNNEVINIGDSGFDYDCYANSNPHDVWIFNNVYHMTQHAVDNYAEYFRLYCSTSQQIQSINNFKIFNNTYVDNQDDQRTMWIANADGSVPFSYSITASGNEIRNNLYYNCGTTTPYDSIWLIANSSGFTSNSFQFNNNIYYASGTRYVNILGSGYTTTATWIASHEPNSTTAQPNFAAYTTYNAASDFHLGPSDTVAIGKGVNLSSYFTTDKDGNPRGTTWDIGAYQHLAKGATRPNPPQRLRVLDSL
jgi:hypothetical protein